MPRRKVGVSALCMHDELYFLYLIAICALTNAKHVHNNVTFRLSTCVRYNLGESTSIFGTSGVYFVSIKSFKQTKLSHAASHPGLY